MKKQIQFLMGLVLVVFASNYAFAGEGEIHNRMLKAQENLSTVVAEQANSENPDLKAVQGALNEVEAVLVSLSKLEEKTPGWHREAAVLGVGGATALVLFARALAIEFGEALGNGLSMIFTAPLDIFVFKRDPVLPQSKSMWRKGAIYWSIGAAGVTVVAYVSLRMHRKKLERELNREKDQALKMYDNTCKVYGLLKRNLGSSADLSKEMPYVNTLCSNLEMIINQKP